MTSDGTTGIRTILTLRVPVDRVGGVIDFYAELDVLAQSLRSAPALSAELLVAEDGSGEVIATAVWPDEKGYRVWLDDEWRQRSSLELGSFLAESGAAVGEGRRYRIVQSVTRETLD